MAEPGLAQRYARALFAAARGRRAVDDVAADLVSLLAAIDHAPALRLFIEAPNVPTEHKHALVDEVLGGRAHALTVGLLHLLLEKKRALELRAIARAYADLVEEHRGIVRARVTTALPLDEDQRRRLRAALERRTGKSVTLEPRVDREAIGGVIVQMGDQILDDSVRTRMAEIREALLGAEL